MASRYSMPPGSGAVVDIPRSGGEPLTQVHLGLSSHSSYTSLDSHRKSLPTPGAVILLREAEEDSVERHRIRLFLGFLALTHIEGGLASLEKAGGRRDAATADSMAGASKLTPDPWRHRLFDLLRFAAN